MYSKPTLAGIALATAVPFVGALAAHAKSYNKEYFYNAFAAHALDMREKDIEESEILKLPRIDREITKFTQSGTYKAPSNLSLVMHFRTAIIAATTGSAMAIVGSLSEKGYDVLGLFRKEEKEISQASGEPKPLAKIPHPLPASQP